MLPLAVDLLWADPVHECLDRKGRIKFRPNKGRGISWYWGAAVVREFLAENALQLLIRAHECHEEGFGYASGGAVLTVFSAPHYRGRSNYGAAAVLTEPGAQIKMFLFDKF